MSAVPHREDAGHELYSIRDPFTDEPYSRDPRQIATKAQDCPVDRHRRHRLLRPRGRVLGLRRRALRDQAERGYYYIDSIGRCLELGREERGGNRGYKTRYKGGWYFPVRRSTTTPTCATR